MDNRRPEEKAAVSVFSKSTTRRTESSTPMDMESLSFPYRFLESLPQIPVFTSELSTASAVTVTSAARLCCTESVDSAKCDLVSHMEANPHSQAPTFGSPR